MEYLLGVFIGYTVFITILLVIGLVVYVRMKRKEREGLLREMGLERRIRELEEELAKLG